MYRIEILSLLAGTVLPLLVGLVSKESWPAGRKAILLAALSAVAAVLGCYLALPSLSWQNAVLNGLAAFLTAVGTNLGFYQPTGVEPRLTRFEIRPNARHRKTAEDQVPETTDA